MMAMCASENGPGLSCEREGTGQVRAREAEGEDEGECWTYEVEARAAGEVLHDCERAQSVSNRPHIAARRAAQDERVRTSARGKPAGDAPIQSFHPRRKLP